MSYTKAARLYFHIGNSGFSVSIEDNGNGPEFIFEGGAFGHQMVRSQMLTTKEGLRELGAFLVEQSAREFSAPYCHATEMPEPRRVDAAERSQPAPVSSDDAFVQLEQHRRAQQEAHGDYLREQIQQYGATQSMADRARAADQLNTGMPNGCAGSTACDHAAGLCGAMGSGGEG